MTDLLVYIPDLPLTLNILSDDPEKLIQTCIEKNQRMKLAEVKCHLKLGVAVLRMTNEDDKNHLVSNVESLILDKKHSINISFTNKLELHTYVVVDRNTSKIPSTDEVARRYAQAYKTSKIPTCRSVSFQFPNIFQIIRPTLDELINVANEPDFRIETDFAIVYPRADCSFFEDLLTNTNEEKITSAIATQIGESQLAMTSFYVQCNKRAGNAIVLASKSNKKWTMDGHLTIDGQNISKKAKLAYRALVTPVPRGSDVNYILSHPLLTDAVVSHKHIDDKLIIEFKDFDHYKYCIKMGGFGLDGNMMAIKEHAVVTDPDTSELDAFNWYETSMFDMKPDIMTIINNHQHPIFRYKWNADNWLQQMKKADRISAKHDTTRHLLRVTVMLNTIGVLRKKRYIVDDKEVTLKLEQMKTIGYNHDSKLSKGGTILETKFKTLYPLTTVKVVNEDCLVVYEQLVAKGHRPLLLNMANAINPGGGYRKGDGAQEENLFRRSDYYHSLDGDIADKERSERLICTSKYELKALKGFGDFYPIDEFGAIYTSGITVFRGSEAEGYPYMKNPLYNVSAIAMPAYRKPQLNKKNMLENRPAMNTHRKIQNIFAIAHQNNHDCLVLSALGCGAFGNPPKHIASLFKSVIYQYAGYFEKIYFAIIDDHNTGNQINPDGNFVPFKKLLDELVVEPVKTLRVAGVSGPYRVLEKTSDGQLTLSDACISYLPPCQHGINCRNIKETDHTREFSHPPRCSLQSAKSQCDQMDDEVHISTFLHTIKCEDGGECKNEDPAHLSDVDHPEFCKDGPHCANPSLEHLFDFRHLPICEKGVVCPKLLRHEEDHVKLFRHCRSVCPHDNCCTEFHDKTHWKNTIHSFREPCPFTPYNCWKYVEFVQNDKTKQISPEVEQHCLQYSHVCLHGRECSTKDDRHYETTIHIARYMCPDGDKCSKITKEDHLESFTHAGIRDIRLFCRDPGFKCKQRRDGRHLKIYRHGQNYDHLTVAPSSNLNSRINFVQNQGQLISNVYEYVDKSSWKKATISPEIFDWIRALQPVHRCSPHIFQSILVHGHFMSRHYMTLLKIPREVANAVLQHKEVRAIILKHNNRGIKENAFELIHALVFAEFSKTGADGIMSLTADHKDKVNRANTKLRASLNEDDLKTINYWTVKIAQASVALHNAPTGIGYDVDQKLGTDKHVFGILGPHRGFEYGDIVIIFKQEIMFHPDTNFSIQAGTSFYSWRTYTHRPWTTDPGTEGERVKVFHSSKLHCSVPRYEHAAGIELVALTGLNTKSMNVDLNDVIHRSMRVDSHQMFECHLAQRIPLDYVDCVYMPKNIFDLLTPEAQKSTVKTFQNRLIISDHIVDLGQIQPNGIIKELDSTRVPYQKYILDQTNEKIRQNMNSPRISRGIVITVPGSKFEAQTVLPITITQSYYLYRLDNNKAPNNPKYTYIYWQAMHGDMMLTIANDKIESSKDQPSLRCLVCYVAEKPSILREDYHEEYSYLNDGHPFRHDTNVPVTKFRAKSNVFYRGCNTDDFFTFCLKISHNTGEVTLSHAGPSGIYNHEKIYYKFNKTDLDLSRIDYIHVSGGNQDVPIRNLTINHELVPELHPSFDKDFKINTSGLQNNRRASADYIVRIPHHENPSSNYKGDALGRQRSSSVPPPPRPPPPRLPPPSQTKKKNFLKRLIHAIFGSTAKDNIPAPSEVPPRDRPRGDLPPRNRSRDESPPRDRPRGDLPPRNRSRDESPPRDRPRGELPPRNRSRDESPRASRPRAKSPPRAPLLRVSKLPPCHDSIYCLNQNSKEHMEQYSHPCRFNELCRRQADEPHLNHERHNVSRCSDDKDCSKKTDPVHRATYRHTGLPDYLCPCRYQDTCYEKSPEHRIRFFHGEELPLVKKNKTLTPAQGRSAPKAYMKPYHFGNGCRTNHDP